jgi:hypothetical protein
MPSIDNMTGSVKDVRNICITPVFSHVEGEPNKNSTKPIGILQFINKKNMDPIT